MSDVLELLKETGALLEGHFLLSSGRHSDRYFQCAKLLQHPQKAREALSEVTRRISRDIKEGKLKVDMTAGPAIGGIIAAWEVARQLGLPSVFTERGDSGIMTLRRGFDLRAGTNVLIVEDVVTTGKSSLECAEALYKSGAVVTSLACIVDRRAGKDRDIPWPVYSAVILSAANWEACDCDLCKKGIPAVKPGSRM